MRNEVKFVRRHDYYFMPLNSFGIMWFFGWVPSPIFVIIFGHFLYAYSFWLIYHPSNWSITNAYSLMSSMMISSLCILAVTAGKHRLWSHKSYHATVPLRLFLTFCDTLSGQISIHYWVRFHRAHHKGSDTDADPHNAKRGFLFAHMIWFFYQPHPEVRIMLRKLDSSDLHNDLIIRFQYQNYPLLSLIFAFLLPISLPCLLFGETLFRSFFIVFVHRYLHTLHTIGLINSAAHMYGDTPYDKTIEPRENAYANVAMFGEGYHNFHHTFPYDYRAAEDGSRFNLVRLFLDLMGILGLASDFKTVSDHTIATRKKNNLLY